MHFVRHAGHRHDDFAITFDPPAGRRSDRVREIGSGLNSGGLFDVALRHGSAAANKKRAQLFFEMGLDLELLAHHLSDRFAGQIVLGRSEAAAGNDDVRAFQPTLEGIRQPLQVVTDLRHVMQIQPQRRQLLGQEVGIGIDDLPEEELCAD